MNRWPALRRLVALTLVVAATGCGGGAGEVPVAPPEPPVVPTPPATTPAPPTTAPPTAPPTAPGAGSPSAAPSDVQGTAGDGQREYMGSPLAEPLVVTVRDAQGRQLAGVNVAWAVGQGGGGLSAAAATTDTLGQSRSSWTLGAAAGPQTVTARVEGLAPVTFTAIAEGDSTAPRLVGYTLDRREVSVDTAAAAVTVQMTVTDSGSGVGLVGATFNSPATGQYAGCGAVTNRLESGTKRQGVWSCRVSIPRQAEAGVWTLSQLWMRDAAGNERRHHRPALEAAGLPTTLIVASATADTVAPALAGFSFTPNAVDVAADSQRVRFTFRVTDAGLGVRAAYAMVHSPSGALYRQCLDPALAAGTTGDGTWGCSVAIPRGAEAGSWAIARVVVHDANNRREYPRAQLRAAGFPTELAVASAAPDTVPPKLVAFSVTPDSLNLSTGVRRVEFTMGVEDEGTGVATVSASARPPGVAAYTGCVAATPVEGTRARGTFRCALLLSEHGAAGAWEITVAVHDAVGHLTYYSAERLKAAGFRSTVTVTR